MNIRKPFIIRSIYVAAIVVTVVWVLVMSLGFERHVAVLFDVVTDRYIWKELFKGDDKITGNVLSIATDHIELNLYNGNFYSAGFSCDAQVCESTKKIQSGDNVLVNFGSKNRKNVLLSIRKCASNDSECANTITEMIEEDKIREKRFKKFQESLEACMVKVENEVLQDKRFSKLKVDSSAAFHDDKPGLGDRDCINDFIHSYSEAKLKSCKKQGCGIGIGGGCAHLTGIIQQSVYAYAVERCAGR